jgi:hypothetical protein
MKVTGWKANEKGTLRGFFSLLLDSGLQIDGMSYHEKEGKTWVSFPSRPYQGDDGSTKWQSILRIPEDARWRQFQVKAQVALEEARKSNGEPDGEVPF